MVGYGRRADRALVGLLAGGAPPSGRALGVAPAAPGAHRAAAPGGGSVRLIQEGGWTRERVPMVGYGRRADWALAALLAVGAPLTGLALVVAQAALVAYGPSLLADNWAGTALLFVMMMAGYAVL